MIRLRSVSGPSRPGSNGDGDGDGDGTGDDGEGDGDDGEVMAGIRFCAGTDTV